jgi:hypothetical protein
MPNLVTRIVLFLSSYTPLFLIMGVKYGLVRHYFGLAMLGLSVLSIGALCWFLASAKRFASDRVTVEKISGKDTEAMSYIVTYLIPFLDIKIDEASNWVSLLLLFLVVAILYVHSNLIYINPTLNLMNYHLFEIEIDGGKTTALLSKRSFVERGTQISVISLGDQIVLEALNAA